MRGDYSIAGAKAAAALRSRPRTNLTNEPRTDLTGSDRPRPDRTGPDQPRTDLRGVDESAGAKTASRRPAVSRAQPRLLATDPEAADFEVADFEVADFEVADFEVADFAARRPAGLRLAAGAGCVGAGGWLPRLAMARTSDPSSERTDVARDRIVASAAATC